MEPVEIPFEGVVSPAILSSTSPSGFLLFLGLKKSNSSSDPSSSFLDDDEDFFLRFSGEMNDEDDEGDC